MTPAALTILPLLLVLSGTGLKDRVEEFHETLRTKEIDSYSTRESIRKFFLSDDDVSNFIVAITQRMQEKRFRNYRITGWRVAGGENREDEAVEEIIVYGKWLWFFTTRFVFKEDWVKREGEWYFIPPKVIPIGR